ncbi:spore coat protein [Ferroacidibacillus organovorans]|uniref:Coat protein F n=1 Tax=Ferroacidibacillus organovorans TaxID=1765683 RepID=A0A101XP03_9BACL|nr:spore coat protein [Ferroacidibacillus organovorans]KUO94952.1 hypothetical protein ATW55_04775 [Ferroacidibacillus organovorans]
MQQTMNRIPYGMDFRDTAMQMEIKDRFHAIILLLKHNIREYATAVTEASCPMVRQTLQRLLYETIAEQAECYQVMRRQGWYPPGATASRDDVMRSIQNNQQAAQEIAQAVAKTGMRSSVGATYTPATDRYGYETAHTNGMQHQHAYQPQGTYAGQQNVRGETF